MKNRIGWLVIICFLLSVCSVIVLYAMTKELTIDNGFTRTFKDNAIQSHSWLDIKYNSYYIAGLTGNRIFLSNYSAPTHILTSNYNLTDTQSLLLKVPHDNSVTADGIHVTIDYPDVHIIDRITTKYFSGNIYDSCRYVTQLDTLQFSKSAPISTSSIVLRTYDNKLQQNILVNSVRNPGAGLQERYILEKHTEGVFSTDGMIVTEKSRGYVMYIYYYRNQFVVLDTNLNLIYKSKTIDTFSVPNIKVADLASEKVSTISAPPLLVNKKCSVNRDYLYVNSGLVASNENRTLFNKTSVMDVYSLVDGTYLFSFHLPDFDDKKITDFRVINKTLVALYENYLVTYPLYF